MSISNMYEANACLINRSYLSSGMLDYELFLHQTLRKYEDKESLDKLHKKEIKNTDSIIPLRVLHIIRLMNHGGAETLIMNLYRNIDRTKVQFDFVETSQETGLYEKEICELGGRVFHAPNFSGKNVLEYIKWWDSFFVEHENEFCFVHGHLGGTAAIYLSSAKKHSIITIAHSHNTYTNFSVRQSFYRIMAYPTRHIADYFFACSNQAAVSRFGKRVNYMILNNAIDTNMYSFSGKQYLPFTKGKTVYGHIGRFRKQKNQPFVAEIFGEIYKKDPNSILIFVGDGASREELEKKIKETIYKDAVFFLGARNDIPDLLRCMDLMLFPSFFEGLPVTLVEAQCSGLRCLISDCISDEAILIPDLIAKMSLDSTSSEWAQKALSMSHYERKSGDQQIKAAGFDIQRNAQWLQDFYIREAGNHE